jgi:hypothetical protein
MCAFVRFIPVHECFNLCGEELANGCGALVGQRLCVSYGFGAEAQGQSLLSHLSRTLPLLRSDAVWINRLIDGLAFLP